MKTSDRNINISYSEEHIGGNKMVDLFLVGVFLFTILYPGTVVFGITLQLLSSESKLSKKLDKIIMKFIDGSKTEES